MTNCDDIFKEYDEKIEELENENTTLVNVINVHTKAISILIEKVETLEDICDVLMDIHIKEFKMKGEETMRQTSEQFVNAMLEDDAPPSTKSISEQMAEFEKRLSDKIAETENKIMSRFEEPKDETDDDVSRETSDDETDVEEIENEDENEKGE